MSTSMAVGYALNLFQISDDSSMAEQLQAYAALTDYLDAIEYALQNVNIYYYPLRDSPVVHSQSRHYRPIAEAAWLQPVLEGKRAAWLCMPEGNAVRLALARPISDSQNYQQSIGVIVIAFESDTLANSLAKLDQNQSLCIHMKDGTSLCGSMAQELIGMTLTEGVVQRTLEDGSVVLVCRNQLLDSEVYLTSVVSYGYLGDSLRTLVMWIVLAFTMAVLIVITYAGSITRRLSAPLRELTKSISNAAKGAFNRLEIQSEQPEVRTLVDAYNIMADQIGDLLKEQYRLGQEINRAELMALQSQINPHFLYNTLDMVNWMAERNDKENIQRVIQAMSRFYRLALSRGSNTITIGEEIQLCETYLTIQQTRFHGRIAYEKDVSADILDYIIPKITLQPFVENAILHGLRVTQDVGGTVAIHGWMEDGRVILAVVDDGVGMAESELKRSLEQNGKHYGLKNIRTRLSIFYQEEIHLDVESTPGAGTCVSINIPAVKKEEHHA